MQPTESVLASELRKFLNEYRYLFVLLVGLTVAFIAEPTLAQCVGWMCGPKTAITNNAVINGNGAAGVFIEFILLRFKS
ncbi:MAG: hypothetical protein HC768_19880 [Acaryochloris sp. CRU_2_0]|nr:hypothetical protein [Acaryochloris sp. CRU_2_0]